jgi:hypothetical protein
MSDAVSRKAVINLIGLARIANSLDEDNACESRIDAELHGVLVDIEALPSLPSETNTDYISRKALQEKIEFEEAMASHLPYQQREGALFMAESMRIYATKAQSIPTSEGAAEGRYREALEKIASHKVAEASVWSKILADIAREALSHSGEPPVPSKSSMGLLLKEEVREPVSWFARQMETRLKANDHKGGWENDPVDYLLARIEQEATEVFHATGSPGSLEKVIEEAADVANFAMMIADNMRRFLIKDGDPDA